MNKEKVIGYFCGMTWPQWTDLVDAGLGGLQRMNGSRHDVMKALIDDNLKLTRNGWLMLERGHALLKGVPVMQPEYQVGDAAAGARFANRHLQGHLQGFWVRSAHIKLLAMVAVNPGMHSRYAHTIFGWRTCKEIVDAGLVLLAGCDEPWEWLMPSERGLSLLERLKKVEVENG